MATTTAVAVVPVEMGLLLFGLMCSIALQVSNLMSSLACALFATFLSLFFSSSAQEGAPQYVVHGLCEMH